ncbi:hypothetical protein VCRA219O19_20356 [Vibrio crassostreae]|nr:hypothetical protein VCRA219O19_20356 [Vibrio crassostreae]
MSKKIIEKKIIHRNSFLRLRHSALLRGEQRNTEAAENHLNH